MAIHQPNGRGSITKRSKALVLVQKGRCAMDCTNGSPVFPLPQGKSAKNHYHHFSGAGEYPIDRPAWIGLSKIQKDSALGRAESPGVVIQLGLETTSCCSRIHLQAI